MASLGCKVVIKVMFPSLIQVWEWVRHYVGRDHGVPAIRLWASSTRLGR